MSHPLSTLLVSLVRLVDVTFLMSVRLGCFLVFPFPLAFLFRSTPVALLMSARSSGSCHSGTASSDDNTAVNHQTKDIDTMLASFKNKTS